MKKPFILLSLLVVFFGASSRIHAQATDITLENCTAKFFSDAALTNEITSFEIVEKGGSEKYLVGPDVIYIAFPVPDNVDISNSTVLMWTNKTPFGIGYHDMKSLGKGKSVEMRSVNGKKYLIGVENVKEEGAALFSILQKLRFRANIGETGCVTDNEISSKRVSPAVNISIAFCYEEKNDKYKAGVEIKYDNFMKGGTYAFYYPGVSFSNPPRFSPTSSSGFIKLWDYESEKMQIPPGSKHKFSVGFVDMNIFVVREIDYIEHNVGPEQGFPSCADGIPDPDDPRDAKASAFVICDQAGVNKDLCHKCFEEQDGLWTAFGCVPYGKDGNFSSIIRAILQLGLGIGGGMVVLMVLAGGFILSTSQGDPNRVKEAKEMVTSAVMGLVFVIFSITILRFIGIQILQIPGFGS